MGDTKTAYVVTFERIGRNHNVALLRTTAESAEDLADQVYDHGRGFLRSRDVEVLVNLRLGRGFFMAGVRNAGNFTIAEDSGGGEPR